ncbi:MAG: hypothetical protein IBX71_02455 [Candidatus Desulforudis sp.]|nr:hypothetical protein [Desulforudis sp.]
MKKLLLYGLILVGLGVVGSLKPMILGQAGYYSARAVDEQEIERVIERAVGSLEYTRARDRDELERLLGEIYTAPALEMVAEAVWSQWRTDNVNPASIVRWTDFQIDRDRARVRADLYFRDWADNAELYGEGRWELAKTGFGWRITDFAYDWGFSSAPD